MSQRYSDHTSRFLSGHVIQKVLWPPSKSKYGGLRPRIWVSVTSKMLLPLATTNCDGFWPQKSKIITVGYPKKWSAQLLYLQVTCYFVRRFPFLLISVKFEQLVLWCITYQNIFRLSITFIFKSDHGVHQIFQFFIFI